MLPVLQQGGTASQLLRTMTAKNDYVGKGVGPCFSVQHLWSKCFREHVTVREVASFMVEDLGMFGFHGNDISGVPSDVLDAEPRLSWVFNNADNWHGEGRYMSASAPSEQFGRSLSSGAGAAPSTADHAESWAPTCEVLVPHSETKACVRGSDTERPCPASISHKAPYSTTGAWDVAETSIYYLDRALAKQLAGLVNLQSVIELGAGIGCYTWTLLHQYGIDVRGFDGAPHIAEATHGLVLHADLTRQLTAKPASWLVCLEVAEHIPAQFEDAFLDNLHQLNCEGIVISWAAPGQKGNGHVNPRTPAWVVQRFGKMGYVHDARAQEGLRRAAQLKWFQRGILVFRRQPNATTLPATCPARPLKGYPKDTLTTSSIEPRDERKRRHLQQGTSLIDLLPPAATMNSLDPIPFDSLLGTSTPVAARFTCSPYDGQPLESLTTQPAVWTHVRKHYVRHNASSPITLSEVGIGMMIGNLTDGSRAKTTTDKLLVAARRTWMRWPGSAALEMLVLGDRSSSGCARQPPDRGDREGLTVPWMARAPLWLNLSEVEGSEVESVPSIHWRCYIGHGWGEWKGGHSSPAPRGFKLAAMLSNLYTSMPSKRLYLKMDDDTLLLPFNLQRICEYVGMAIHPNAPLYLGANNYRLYRPGTLTRATQKWSQAVYGPACRHSKAFPTGFPCVTRSTGWKALEVAEGWGDDARRIAQATVRIEYAQGGAYALSRAALQRIVTTDCPRAIASLTCNGSKAVNGSCVMAEDATMGLCMHLKLVRLVDCHAFHADPPCFLSRPPVSVGSSCAENKSASRLARFPVSIHKMKDPEEWAHWWAVLKARAEQMQGPELASWRGMGEP